MHDNIFQVSRKPIARDDYPDTDLIAENTEWIGYCDEVDKGTRLNAIKHLVDEILPEGMFSIDSEGDVLTYIGGLEEWAEEYVKKIQDAANKLTPSNILTWCKEKKALKDIMRSPIGHSTMFVLDNNLFAEFSCEFIEYINDMQPGDKLFIGSVLNYHP